MIMRQTISERIQEAEIEYEKREKHSPFKRWYQFNSEHTKALMWLALKHPKAQAILYFLVDQMDSYNAVMCSYKVLQEVLDISKDTVRINIKILKDNGFIAVLKSGTSNVYAVNDSVYWKSWGKNLMYSKFPANVVLALSEQEALYQAKVSSQKIKCATVGLDETDEEEVLSEIREATKKIREVVNA